MSSVHCRPKAIAGNRSAAGPSYERCAVFTRTHPVLTTWMEMSSKWRVTTSGTFVGTLTPGGATGKHMFVMLAAMPMNTDLPFCPSALGRNLSGA